MANWTEVFQKGLLEKCGKNASTTREFAAALEKRLKESVTVDSLFNAHKRHRDRLGLKPSLTDYMAPPEEPKQKKAKLKPEDIKFAFEPDKRRAVKKAKRYIVTSAMNNCHVVDSVWESINHYAKKNDAEIIVIPVRYKNPTSQRETRNIDDEAWWDECVLPHTTDQHVRLHEHLWLMAHVRVQATAVNPLSGLEAMSKGASGIFGHSQLAMKMVATPQHKLPKVLYTTGSCTKDIYSDTKAGVKGKFHHNYGALIV